MVNLSHDKAGLFCGIGAYVLWDVLPLYLHPLKSVPPIQVVSHRMFWSLLLFGTVIVATRRLRPLLAAARG